MARTKASILSVRQKRLQLPVSRKPYFESLGDGVSVGYRRNQSAGAWVARKADGAGGSSQRVIGTADDYKDADGEAVLNWGQAQAKAFALASRWNGAPSSERPFTVGAAVEAYADDLKVRGGDVGNVARLRCHLPAHLKQRRVTHLQKGELRAWRDGLLTHLTPASVNRTGSALKAAFNLAAEHREEIIDKRLWATELAALPDANSARNVILPDRTIRKIVAASYEVDDAFGLLVETAAVTGARYSQIASLKVSDLQDDRSEPRLMMPSARKGRGLRRVLRRPVPIPSSLASRLRAHSHSRSNDAPLLAKLGACGWRKSDQTRPFREAVRAAGLSPLDLGSYTPAEVTIYALRHSSMARQILRNVPVRVVAVMHDTSVAMIEKNYSALLADHFDGITRAALLDLNEGVSNQGASSEIATAAADAGKKQHLLSGHRERPSIKTSKVPIESY